MLFCVQLLVNNVEKILVFVAVQKTKRVMMSANLFSCKISTSWIGRAGEVATRRGGLFFFCNSAKGQFKVCILTQVLSRSLAFLQCCYG